MIHHCLYYLHFPHHNLMPSTIVIHYSSSRFLTIFLGVLYSCLLPPALLSGHAVVWFFFSVIFLYFFSLCLSLSSLPLLFLFYCPTPLCLCHFICLCLCILPCVSVHLSKCTKCGAPALVTSQLAFFAVANAWNQLVCPLNKC